MTDEVHDEEAAWRDLIARLTAPVAADGTPPPWPAREELPLSPSADAAGPDGGGPAGTFADPLRADPQAPGWPRTDPRTPGSAQMGQARADSAHADPTRANPTRSGPSRPDPSRPDSSRAGPSHPDPRADPSGEGFSGEGFTGEGPSRPGPARPDQARADRSRADPAPPARGDPIPGVIPAPPQIRIVRPAAPPPRPADDDPDDHYVPPPPPPLPRLDPVSKGAWAALFGGPVYLLLAIMLGWVVPGWAAFCAVAAFVGGFATLVVRLGDRPPHDSGPDNGAVV